MKNICFQMTRKAWLVAFMVICSVFPALAQTITVKGTVIDKEGEPLIGASVLVKGETLGAATDFDGQFTIQAPTNGIIVVSYVGYDTQEIPVDGRTEINITMTENSVILGEVVAIGYGVVKKSDATGSVAVIKPDDIEAGIAVSTQDLLVGASPGVTVTTNGGNPNGGATIRIRGGSSLSANNHPLVVIDGVPMSDQSMANGANAMTLVNPQDIESLTVLKDASATAIYGSRASNGVIIIQTKKGSSGAPKFNFAANFHVNTARKTLDLMSGTELTKFFEERDIVPNSAMGTANTDWQKEVLRTSFSHDYNLSVSGTVGQTLPYRISGSFTDSEGIIKTSSMKRTTVGINLSPKFFNGMLSVNANLNGTYIKNREADTGAIGAASAFNPSLPVYTDYPTAGDTGRTIFNGFTNILSGSGGLKNRHLSILYSLFATRKTTETFSSQAAIFSSTTRSTSYPNSTSISTSVTPFRRTTPRASQLPTRPWRGKTTIFSNTEPSQPDRSANGMKYSATRSSISTSIIATISRRSNRTSM